MFTYFYCWLRNFYIFYPKKGFENCNIVLKSVSEDFIYIELLRVNPTKSTGLVDISGIFIYLDRFINFNIDFNILIHFHRKTFGSLTNWLESVEAHDVKLSARSL